MNLKKEKPCPQCEEIRKRTEFHGHPTRKDRLQPICKYCQKNNTARYKAEQREKDPVCPWGVQGKSLIRLVEKQIHRLQEWRRS